MVFTRVISTVSSYQTYYIFKRYSTGTRQVVRSINKLMGNTKKKKMYQQYQSQVDTSEILCNNQTKGKKSGNPRRATVLNKLFMRHITDLLSTGEYSSEIVGHGIEISKVKITPDYRFLRIYWFCKEHADDILVEKLLNKNAGYLEHEMSQLRVMGKVPTMQFVKDKLYNSIAAVDQKLAVADFGDDFIPQDSVSKLKAEFELFSSLSDHVKEKIKNIESVDKDEYFETPVPVMSQNIFGVDHGSILARVKNSMKKSSAVHPTKNYEEDVDKNWAKFKVTQPINENPVILSKNKSQSVAFKEFIQKHQLQKLKAQAKKYNSSKLEFTSEEVEQFHPDEETREIQKDYIIEDEFGKEYK